MKKGSELGEPEYRAYGGLLGLEGIAGMSTVSRVGIGLAGANRQALIEGFSTEAAIADLSLGDPQPAPPYSPLELQLVRDQGNDITNLLTGTINRLAALKKP